jgi:precorrin-2 dehydrogenase / sirohydrochlorin ferrochelatase
MEGKMRYYPAFLDLRGTSCLVVGGGQVGERKVKTLLECGALVHLVSPELTPFLEEEVRQGRVRRIASDFAPSQMDGMFLVIGATDDPEINRRVSVEARSRNLLCNIVDRPRECSFIVPSTITRGDLILAVSTGGQSPALAKKIRQELENLFPDSYSWYVALLGRIREYVLAQGFPQAKNQRIFESLIDAPILEWLQGGDLENLTNRLVRLLDQPPSPQEVEDWLRELNESLPATPGPAAGIREAGKLGKLIV